MPMTASQTPGQSHPDKVVHVVTHTHSDKAPYRGPVRPSGECPCEGSQSDSCPSAGGQPDKPISATNGNTQKSDTPARRRPPWTGPNPWRRRHADRLAAAGGQYRAPQPDDPNQRALHAEQETLLCHPVRMREEAEDLHRCPEVSGDCW